MSEEKDEKVSVEQNGETKEVSREKVEEMRQNPDYQVENAGEGKVKVKQRLMD